MCSMVIKKGRRSNKVQYHLVKMKNQKEGTERYAARTISRSSNLKTIAEQMVNEGSKYSEYEILGIAEHLIKVIIEELREGKSVNFGSVMHFRPSIKGVFTDKEETFDAAKHKVCVAVSAGSQLRNVLKDVPVELLKAEAVPEITSVQLTPSAQDTIVQLFGRHLYCEGLGERAKWFVKKGKQRTEVTPLMQKKSGREVLVSLPQKTYPTGTEVTFILQKQDGNISTEYASNPIVL